MSGKRDSQQEKLDRLLAKAQEGDRSVLPALRKMLDEGSDSWDQLGDVALQAQRSLVSLYAGKNSLASEALERTLAEMRAWLEGPTTSPLERLLADRVVTCWLAVHEAERMYAGQLRGDGIIALADFLQRRLDAAHRRYLSAIKTLAQVRRLLGPTVQVNIAEKQVNVAG